MYVAILVSYLTCITACSSLVLISSLAHNYFLSSENKFFPNSFLPSMKTVFENIHITRMAKEKGLRVSNIDANLHLLPKGNSILRVQCENRELGLEFKADGDSLIIHGKEWRDFFHHYDPGATVSLYLDDNGSYKIGARR